jgi:molybdenum cofactor synthesis domain-containing protein
MASATTPPLRAAILLIGNELLSGKVEDENARYLTRELRELGVTLGRVLVIPDVSDEIAEAVRDLSNRYDHVFTSGGVGPTHDDVTLVAVGAAFGMPVARNAELERLLRSKAGPNLHERDLRMADVPTGARLEYGPGATTPPTTWPIVVVRNVWVLPGVPKIFRRKFETVRELFRSPPIHARAVYSREGEGPIAGVLDEVVAEFPMVEVGSYPHLDTPDYCVKITLDGRDRAAVDAATEHLVRRLGDVVVRTE